MFKLLKKIFGPFFRLQKRGDGHPYTNVDGTPMCSTGLMDMKGRPYGVF